MATAREILTQLETEDLQQKSARDILTELESEDSAKEETRPITPALSPHQLEAQKSDQNKQAFLRYSGIGPVNKIVGKVNEFLDNTMGVQPGPYQEEPLTPQQERFRSFNPVEKALSTTGRTIGKAATGMIGFVPSAIESLVEPKTVGASTRGGALKELGKGFIKMPASVVPTAYDIAARLAGSDDPSQYLPESWRANYREMINEVAGAPETPVFGAMMGAGALKAPGTMKSIARAGRGAYGVAKDRIAGMRRQPEVEPVTMGAEAVGQPILPEWDMVAEAANLPPMVAKPVGNLIKSGKIDAAERLYNHLTKDSPDMMPMDEYFRAAREPKPVEMPVEQSPEVAGPEVAVTEKIAEVRARARRQELVKPPEESKLKETPESLTTTPEVKNPLPANVSGGAKSEVYIPQSPDLGKTVNVGESVTEPKTTAQTPEKQPEPARPATTEAPKVAEAAKPPEPKPPKPTPPVASGKGGGKMSTWETPDEYVYHRTSPNNLESIRRSGLLRGRAGEYPHGRQDIADAVKRIYFGESPTKTSDFGGGLVMRVRKDAISDNVKVVKMGVRGEETWYFGNKVNPSDIEVRNSSGGWDRLARGKRRIVSPTPPSPVGAQPVASVQGGGKMRLYRTGTVGNEQPGTFFSEHPAVATAYQTGSKNRSSVKAYDVTLSKPLVVEGGQMEAAKMLGVEIRPTDTYAQMDAKIKPAAQNAGYDGIIYSGGPSRPAGPFIGPKAQGVREVVAFDKNAIRDAGEAPAQEWYRANNSPERVAVIERGDKYVRVVDLINQNVRDINPDYFERNFKSESPTPPSPVGKAKEGGEPTPPPGATLGSPGSTARGSIKSSLEGKTEPVSKQQVIDHFSKSFNIPIRFGRFKEQAMGVYKTQPEVVRSKSWGDLVNISHEIGHHIENNVFGGHGSKSGIGRELPKEAKQELIAMGKALYGDKQPAGGYRSEGFAEFIAHHLVGTDTKPLAPIFTDWFEKSFLPANRDIAKTLASGRDLTTRWYQQGAYSRVYSQIGATPKNILSQVTKPWLQKQVARFKDLWADSGATIELFEKDVRGLKKITPETVDPATSPTQLYRADKMSATSKAISMVRDGTFDFAGNQTGPSLKAILKPVGKHSKDFIVYAYARRALDLVKRDINPGISEADARFIVGKYESPAFRKTLDDLTQWQGRVLDYVVESGALSPDAKAAIEYLNPVYIPLKRVLDTEGGFGSSKKIGDLPDAIKKIHGSGRPIQDPLESIIRQTAQLISHADRTRIGRTIAQLGDRKGAGKWIEEIPAPQQASKFTIDQMKGELEAAGLDLAEVDLSQVVTVYQNSLKGLARENIVVFSEGGKRRFFQLEPNLYKAAMALDGIQQSLLVRILGAPARALRMGTTALNPEFALGVNPWRDALTYSLQSEYGSAVSKIPLVATLKGTARRFTNNKYRSGWERSGADMSTMVGLDRQSLKKTIGDILSDDKKAAGMNIIKHPLEFLREAMSFSESGPRLAEYEATYKKLAGRYGEGASARIGAVNAAKDVTTDFTRMGRYAQAANALIPFFNVAIQGPSKFARTIKAHPVRSGMFGVAFITTPTIALWTLNKDKDWYRELPAYRKYGCWNFEAGVNDDGTPRIISLPRPFEWGLAFGAGPEAYLNYLNTEDPKQIEEAVGSIWDQLSPGIIPQSLKVPVELWSNYNFFRDREIVPYYMNQNKPPEEQYFQSTPVTYRKLGELFGYSPLKIQHGVEGVTGSITTRAIRAAESATGIKPQEEGNQMADVPVLGRFAVRQQSKDERNERIEYQREQTEAKLRQLIKYGKVDEAQTELNHWNATYPNYSMSYAAVEEKAAKIAKQEETKKLWQDIRDKAQSGDRKAAFQTMMDAVKKGQVSQSDAQEKWREIDLDVTGKRIKNAPLEDAWMLYKSLPEEAKAKYKSVIMSKARSAADTYRAADFTPDRAKKRQQVISEISREM